MKYFKYLILCFMCFPLMVYASSEKIEDMQVDASIDISGNLQVKEIISVDDDFTRVIKFKDSTKSEYDKDNIDYTGSQIYDGSNVEVMRVGLIDKIAYEYDNIEEVSMCDENITTKCYKVNNENESASIELVGIKGNVYIEYLIGNVVVVHNDVAELYYRFVDSLVGNVKNYKLRLILPSPTQEKINLWAHGNIKTDLYLIKEDDTYYGGYLEGKDINKDSVLDLRITMPNSLIMVDHPFLKKTGVDALKDIEKVENKFQKDTKEANELNALKTILVFGLCISYFVITLIIEVYVYIKYSKEIKDKVTKKEIDDLVSGLDAYKIKYVINNNVSKKTMIAIILKLIKDGVITYKERDGQYELALKSEEVSKAYKCVIDIIFDGKKHVKLDNLVKRINENYDTWSKKLKEILKKELASFSKKNKLFYGLYIVLGAVVLLVPLLLQKYQFVSLLTLAILLIYIFVLYKYKRLNIKGARLKMKCETLKNSIDDGDLGKEYFLIGYLLDLNCESEHKEFIEILSQMIN